MKITKIIEVALAATMLGVVSMTSTTAQAKGETETHSVTETTEADGTHYYTIDGKHYTPKAYATWEAKQVNKRYGYDSAVVFAKKSKSGKSVVVTGNFEVLNAKEAKQHKATYVRFKTYKGYQSAKLTQKLTFKKTIKAPKAKTVSIQAGYYSKTKKKGKVFHKVSTVAQIVVKAYK
ncbi:hypothetical protein [Lactiplantibacillus songbeiensis]|uniref:Extracellular protein n=1 Tax=Lactiplantibacillus songbeiensis TaxID=2559920 RepID=A0ABW4C3P1_9LACO|nr:hypothetical protein [Lactiplantibacillus songbeiensis]